MTRPPLNWNKGLLRLWIAASALWIALVAVFFFVDNQYAFVRAPIVVPWGPERVEFPAGSSEDVIRAELERRAAQMDAEDQAFVDKMSEERKTVCRAIPKTTRFDQMPADCSRLILQALSKHVPPFDWEPIVRNQQTTTYLEALPHWLPLLLLPPLALLLLGLVWTWIVRGFKDLS